MIARIPYQQCLKQLPPELGGGGGKVAVIDTENGFRSGTFSPFSAVCSFLVRASAFRMN